MYSNEEDSINLVNTIVRELGGIHTLINNAGGGGGRENPFKLSVDVIQLDFELNVNVFIGWKVCQICLPHMKMDG